VAQSWQQVVGDTNANQHLTYVMRFIVDAFLVYDSKSKSSDNHTQMDTNNLTYPSKTTN
jgi:hypothetical protein